MLRNERLFLNSPKGCECMKLWGVVFFVGFLLANAGDESEQSNFQVEVIDSVAHARNAQDFYEALIMAENGGQNISTIFIDDDFAIRGGAWSPMVTISKNLTIIGGRPNVQVCVSKATVIMRIQNCHVVVKGFTFVPIDSRPEYSGSKRQSEPAWFELDEDATVDFVDMVLEVAGIFKLTNRPVEMSHSDPSFLSRVKEVDNAIVFVEVIMPPVTYINVYFQHKDFQVHDTQYTMKTMAMTFESQMDMLQMLEKVAEMDPHHIAIQLDSDMKISTSDADRALVTVSKVISIAQTEHSKLSLVAKTNPGKSSGLANLIPEGQLHFEAAALEINFDHGPALQNRLQSYFPIVNYPDDVLGPRCLVSFRRSFVLVGQCAHLARMKKSIEGEYLQNVIQTNSTEFEVQYLVGSGICMEDVTISCNEDSLMDFFRDRSRRKNEYGVAFSPFQESHAGKASGDNLLLYLLIVLIVLVFVTVVVFVAIMGNSRRTTFRLPKSRSRNGKTEKSIKASGFVTVSISTDEDEPNYVSYRVISRSNPMAEAIMSENGVNEPGVSHLEPSTWTPAVGLTGMDEEEIVVVEKRVGHGGYGVVYKGRWKGQDVAVKTLSFDQSSGSFGTECPKRQRAILEAGIGSIVNHPNIVQTYSYTFESGERVPLQSEKPRRLKMHMIQEYCEMGSLRMAMDEGQLLCRESNRPDLRFIAQIAQDVTKGMSYLHERNIIHGDLSAKNILLQTVANPEGSVIAKICDFGLSVKLSAADSHLQNCKAGTPLYMAPEVCKYGLLSKKADIYSFGVVMWEAYKCCYKSWEKWAINGSVDFPLECPLQLALLICWCLAPRPSCRPDFGEVLEVLNALMTPAAGAKFNDRKEKKRIRKLATSADVWSSHQIREYLLGGNWSSCEIGPERLPTPRESHVESCLSVKIVKLNQCECLSMTWHDYNQRVCSQVSQLCLIGKCQSASTEGVEVLPQDKKSYVSQSCLASRESDIQKASLHKSRSARLSADAEDLVAKVEWLAEMDSRGLGASDKNCIHPAPHRRLGNNSADRMSNQWRSASVGISESNIFPTRGSDDTIGTGI